MAFLDVNYKGNGARAACVLAASWEADAPISTYVRDIASVEPYQSGSFFRRELPCLVSVLALLPSLPDIVVVDGYVWLSSLARPGLGAYLYDALGRTKPVVGIAKTAFAGTDHCPAVVPVLRGTSVKPLFVTAVGMDPEIAAHAVHRMAGKYRIPELLRIADHLSKGLVSAGKSAA